MAHIESDRPPDPRQIMKLLGSTVVLRSESQEQCDALAAHFVNLIKPRDLIEGIFIKRMVDAVWRIKRYNDHTTLAIERYYEKDLAFQDQRRKLHAAQRQTVAHRMAQTATQVPKAAANLEALEERILDTVEAVDDALKRVPSELAQNKALEGAMDFIHNLERLIAPETRRFNEAYLMLQHHRGAGLGSELHQLASKFLDAEPVESLPETGQSEGAPTLLPPDPPENEKTEREAT